MEKKTILIIDDEQDYCDLIKIHLEKIGNFEVHTATDGKHGVNLAKKIKPNLIVLDLIMPGVSGLEVLENLKKDNLTMEIPVVILSGKDDDLTKTKATQLYDDMYITKPVSAQQLKEKIVEVLRMRGQIN